MDNRTKFCKGLSAIRESERYVAILRAMRNFGGDFEEGFNTLFMGVIVEAIGMNEDTVDAELLVYRINMLNGEMIALVDITLTVEITMEENAERVHEISGEIA